MKIRISVYQTELSPSRYVTSLKITDFTYVSSMSLSQYLHLLEEYSLFYRLDILLSM